MDRFRVFGITITGIDGLWFCFGIYSSRVTDWLVQVFTDRPMICLRAKHHQQRFQAWPALRVSLAAGAPPYTTQ